MNLSDIASHWVALHETLGLGGPIRDEAHYAQLLEVVDQLMDDVPGLESGPMGALVDVLADRIREYEDRVHPWPAQPLAPHELLHELLVEHGLTQAQLPEVGAQSVVSAVLAGKRALNLRQVKALARRFGVSVEVFAG